MNTLIPFICLAIGALLNWKGLPDKILNIIDFIMNGALILLMLVIGVNIGASDEIMSNLGVIGINCLIISLSAIAFSVVLVRICELTVMPLESIKIEIDDTAINPEQQNSSQGFSPLIISMPLCIIIGILLGDLFFQHANQELLDMLLTISLIFLYTGVGVSLGSNKSVFSYIKKLGIRVIFMPLSIFAGCILGGIISGICLGIPITFSCLSAGGMGYYSLTGAFMTENYGIEAGTYGFIVNVSRDVFTVLLLPLLIKISKGSPIASGAAGCMDTMLVPVAKVVGPELGMVALISGTILTFLVPIWLPIGAKILSYIFL